MLRHVPLIQDPNLLVGVETRDDAAVYRLSDQQALVLTTDFFTPVVDDARDFGRVAAANALSDVWAMGAKPILALNLVAFPARKLPLDLLGEIMAGGAEVVQEAGALLAGGHSIDDPEPKYGLAVLGLVDPERIFRNVGARPGDRLLLTKPLGSGVLTTAIKRGLASSAEIREVTELMVGLNKAAAEVLVAHHSAVHAVTDVTGFGLLGHLLEMLEGSGVGAVLDGGAIPILDSARKHAAAGVLAGGSRANLDACRDRIGSPGSPPGASSLLALLADAQTSGGLLAAVDAGEAVAIRSSLRAAGVGGWDIGGVVAGGPRVRLEPVAD